MQNNIPNPFEIMDFRLKNIETSLFRLIQIIDNKPTAIPPETQNEIIFLKDVCRLTNLAKATIYSKISKKEIPYHKTIGQKKVYFLRSEILQFIKNGNQIKRA